MSSFTNKLIVEPLDNGKYKIIKQFTYHVGQYPSDLKIVVPEGFVTDFASIPRILHIFFPPHGKYTKAAIIHDFLYDTGSDKALSDKIFKEAMLVLSVPLWQANLFYHAVKLFGRPKKKINHASPLQQIMIKERQEQL